ncbi:MAG: hypothetical protein JW834_04910 [Candidatus Diapherotrites archaeon]|nr:hypothetical protein [Candidatus Diapherotrites archaeon]
MRILAGVALVVLFSFLLLGFMQLHPQGQPAETSMDDYFLRNAEQETHAENIVTSIVFDYRGFDTLGEATVLFASMSGVLLALGKWSG